MYVFVIYMFYIYISQIYLSKFFLQVKFLKEQIYSDSIWKASYIANTLAEELNALCRTLLGSQAAVSGGGPCVRVHARLGLAGGRTFPGRFGPAHSAR